MRWRIRGGAPAPPRAHHACGSLAASAEAFLTHLAARAYSPPSIEAHRWALKGFVEWADSEGMATPASFTRARIEAFQLHLHQYRTPRGGKPLVTNTQLARLGCVRRFFAWLCRSGVIPANPAADLDLPRKQARQLPKAFSAMEIQALMAVPDPSDAFGLRDRAILELFYATGIRRTEMVNLDHGDYDSASLTLTIRKGKGGKSRMLPVGERAAAWLDRFLAESRPLFHHLPQETALFLSGYGSRITPAYIGNWIKGLMKSCGIDKPGSCHLLRHSCATDMHRGGADIRYVQEMLGHARMETTQIYTHVHIDALREIHARTHPHGRLDETHDMYGLIPAIETPEHDLPSPPAENPLQPEAMWAATAPGPEVSAAQAGISNGSCPEPPDEEPPAGGSPCATPKPPPTGGPSSAKSPLDPHEPAQISTKIQRFRPGVTYYGYRWLDPATGRWPSRDPIEEEGGMNLYGFVGNDGLYKWDRLGLEAALIGAFNGSTCKQTSFKWTKKPSLIDTKISFSDIGGGAMLADAVTFIWEGEAEVRCCCSWGNFNSSGILTGESIHEIHMDNIMIPGGLGMPSISVPAPKNIGEVIAEVVAEAASGLAELPSLDQELINMAGQNLRQLIVELDKTPNDYKWKNGWPCK